MRDLLGARRHLCPSSRVLVRPTTRVRAPMRGRRSLLHRLRSSFTRRLFPSRQDRAPLRQHRGPMRQHRSPLRLHRGPMRQHRGPMRQHRSPLRLHRTPSRRSRCSLRGSRCTSRQDLSWMRAPDRSVRLVWGAFTGSCFPVRDVVGQRRRKVSMERSIFPSMRRFLGPSRLKKPCRRGFLPTMRRGREIVLELHAQRPSGLMSRGPG
jgi:hypothetical protein